ncbi:MAG: hypothetical protein QM766_00905 [Burkholderiaceae bacterium]
MSKELDELQEIARLATRDALESYAIPEQWKNQLVLGCLFDGDYRVFELYIPGERPKDAIVISSARIHRKSKEIEVTVSNLEHLPPPGKAP